MRRARISSRPCSGSNRQRSPFFTSGIGNGQLSLPTWSTVELPLATSLFAPSYALRNFSRLCFSATASPEETSARLSLPRIPNSALVSPARRAATKACVASSADAKLFGGTTAGFAAVAGFAAAGASGFAGAGAWACAGPPASRASASIVTNTSHDIRGIIDDLLRGRHRHRYDRRHRPELLLHQSID